MGMMINRRRVYGGEKGLLPSGYKQLEYIENTSNAYIDTGIYTSNNSHIETKALFYYPYSGNGYQFLFCARKVSREKVVGLNINATTLKYRGHFGSNFYETNLNISHPINISLDKTMLIIDDNIIPVNNTETFNSIATLLLFAGRANGNLSDQAKGKIYNFIHRENENINLNLIPCLSPNNEVGMYDTVTKAFFKSPNGTAFVAGPVV